MLHTRVFQNDEHYIRRTDELMKSGYPVSITILDYDSDETPVIQSHTHDEIEFLYILEGKASVTCEEQDISVSQGDIIFVNSQVSHFITPVIRNEGVFISVVVNPIFIFGLGELSLEEKYLYPILNCRQMNIISISAGDRCHEEFQPQLTQLINLNLNKSPGYEILTKICILKLWVLLYNNYFVMPPASEHISAAHSTIQDEQRVRQALLFIRKHYAESVSLGDIADSILVSKSECCHCFKRVLSMTPFEYLMKYRISQAACHMQKYPNATISEIAVSVGFNNVSYFNKIFKKIMNDTPTNYRRNIKNNTSFPDD